jgi:hypothetical protein
MRRLVPLALGLLLVACGGKQGRPSDGDTSNSAAGTLVVTQDFDRAAGVYIEGSFSYVKVSDAGGVVFEGRMTNDRFQRDLAPGIYTVASYQRPCDGNCGYLDAPTDRCSREITVETGAVEDVHVTVRPGSGCEIDEPGATPSP